MGLNATLDVGSWNAVVWGNVMVTTFLFATRSLYFLGAFGGSQGQILKDEVVPKARTE
jgi:hypothetical protein